MPRAAGVVLASEEGRPVATDVGPGVDARDLARRAMGIAAIGAGTLVAIADRLYFVVLLPRAMAESLEAVAAPASL
jgi:hypothetical protein